MFLIHPAPRSGEGGPRFVQRSAVEGASAARSTSLLHAPSTTLRVVPLPRSVSLRGGGKSTTLPAAHPRPRKFRRVGKGAECRAHVLDCRSVVRVGFASLNPPYKAFFSFASGKQKGGGTPTNVFPNLRILRCGARRTQRARLSAFHRGSYRRDSRPFGATPGQVSWDAAGRPALYGRPNRGGAGLALFHLRAHLSQSRESTSRTGRSAGQHDARNRPRADCKSARGRRTRSVFGCASRTRPSSERECLSNATGDNRQGKCPLYSDVSPIAAVGETLLSVPAMRTMPTTVSPISLILICWGYND